MQQLQVRTGAWSFPLAFLVNLVWVYLLYALCRAVFLWENWGTYAPHFAQLDKVEAWTGTLFFDTSAILYTNALYALLMLLPLPWKRQAVWQGTAKGLFLLVNALAVVVNLGDAVYFKYTGRRTTMSVFSEFSHEGNIASIVGKEVLSHWYLVLLGVALIALLVRLYVHPHSDNRRPTWRYYTVQTLALGLFAPLCVAGMRGGFTTAVRPITLSNANQYVNQPSEAALILNTPFSLIRTVNKTAFVDPKYMTAQEMSTLYSPVHHPMAGEAFRSKNVVVFILESFGKENSGWLNPHLDGGRYKGYTPFLDSLMQESLTFEYSFSNGRKSIDGMPSVLSSIPMFVEPFFLTPASLNHLSGLAGELRTKGYHTAFFHGAANGSMGFQAFAKATGFGEYYGRTEFNADKRFRGDADFDGTWAIWDEPFFQFYAQKMSDFRQPFMTALFSASSHAPYKVPEDQEERYPQEGKNPLNRCVRYSDNALRAFFATARRQPWYKNTLFVLTADHTSLSDHPEYQTPLGVFSVPIVFFDPSGELPKEHRAGIAKQIDIMPTVLGYLGYDKPYIAFGTDLIHTPAKDNYEVAYYNGIYLFAQGDYVLAFDGTKTKSIYNFRNDWMGQHNLVGRVPEQAAMERRLKAIIQSYMQRMTTDQMVWKRSSHPSH